MRMRPIGTEDVEMVDLKKRSAEMQAEFARSQEKPTIPRVEPYLEGSEN